MSSSWRVRQRKSKRRSGQPRTPRGAVAAAQTGADAPVAVAQTDIDAPATGSTEIVAFTGDTTLPPQVGIMVTAGSSHCLGRRSRQWVAYPHQD
jgi:hypothetical protein